MNKSKIKLLYFLVIMTIILLLLFCGFTFSKLGQLETDDTRIPTGNFDIFEIIIEKDKKCETCVSCPICDDETIPVIKPVDPTEPEEPEEPTYDNGELSAEDDEGDFTEQTALRIFENPSYEMQPIIAPGDSNIYTFLIKNNSDFTIIYDLKMTETNPYHMNMKYRLKLNGEYVIGDDDTWVSASSLYKNDLILEDGLSDIYSLDWKWEHNDETDINAGANQASYNLSISFNAEEYFE